MAGEEIKAIDTMCRAFYCSPEIAKAQFGCYETHMMGLTTFAGVAKKLGLGPGEEWQVLAKMGKATVAEMVAEMDEVGVEYVFMDQIKMWSRRESRVGVDISVDKLAGLIKESNGRIIGGAGYNPFQIKESLEDLVRAVEEYNFKYVWFHPNSYDLRYDDRRCYPLYLKCMELGIPVCMQSGHSAEPLNSEQGHPMAAENVAMDFPDLTVVLTHTGWPWVEEWVSMLWRLPNVYGNIGAYAPKDLDPALIKFMDGRGRDKVFWATNGLGLTRCKKEFLELPIRDDIKKKILRDNAIKMFKL